MLRHLLDPTTYFNLTNGRCLFYSTDVKTLLRESTTWGSKSLLRSRNEHYPFFCKTRELGFTLNLKQFVVNLLLTIQFTVFFLSQSPRNMIGQSQSGTGKTAAFVLNMLSRVDYEIQKTQVRSYHC